MVVHIMYKQIIPRPNNIPFFLNRMENNNLSCSLSRSFHSITHLIDVNTEDHSAYYGITFHFTHVRNASVLLSPKNNKLRCQTMLSCRIDVMCCFVTRQNTFLLKPTPKRKGGKVKIQMNTVLL